MILTIQQIKGDRNKRIKAKRRHKRGRKSELSMLIEEQQKELSQEMNRKIRKLRHR